jgi:hypothetical protein
MLNVQKVCYHKSSNRLFTHQLHAHIRTQNGQQITQATRRLYRHHYRMWDVGLSVDRGDDEFECSLSSILNGSWVTLFWAMGGGVAHVTRVLGRFSECCLWMAGDEVASDCCSVWSVLSAPSSSSSIPFSLGFVSITFIFVYFFCSFISRPLAHILFVFFVLFCGTEQTNRRKENGTN